MSKAKTYKKARFFMLSKDANQNKIDRLENLHSAYVEYVGLCIKEMVIFRRFQMPLSEKRGFFPKSAVLSSQIVKNAQSHTVFLVSTWAKAQYVLKMKNVISKLKRKQEITDDQAKALYTVGKYIQCTPNTRVCQSDIDLYWKLLLDKGKHPEAKGTLPMMLSETTCTLARPKKAKSADWWLSISSLTRRKSIHLPLDGNPYVNASEQVSKSVLARKTMKGRWRFDVVEKAGYTHPKAPEPYQTRLGIDVGLNVLAATSDGNTYGKALKPKFDSLYRKIKNIRANRQRQGLFKDSKRLQGLELRLSGMIKTQTNEIANRLVKQHPDKVFVIENLDLRGCRGQKRFAYRALQKSLSMKASVEVVNPAYTSQECPSCGYVSSSNRSGIKFRCRSCGKKTHADWVGASGVLRRSQDKQITCADKPNSVKAKLRTRYMLRRNSPSKSDGLIDSRALPLGRMLTTKGLLKQHIGTASNLIPEFT